MDYITKLSKEVEASDFNTYEACLEAALQKCFIFIK